uniref:Divalent-cation tolerance protein CutA n=1 Tax=Glossina morsitans morsitans TaxID=37546 RepID=D3TRX4_GLOMM
MNNTHNLSQNIILKKSTICIVLRTFPDFESAQSSIKYLLKNKLAACITQLSGATSFYYWNTTLPKKKEVQILIKSNLMLKNHIFPAIKNLHPYDIPELIVLSTDSIEKNYKRWIKKNIAY